MKNYTKLAYVVLVGIALISVLAAFFMSQIRFDYEFEDYFPKSDTEYAYYNSFRNTYGSDNDFVLISVLRTDGIFNHPFLVQIDSLTNQLKKAPYVTSVVGITQLGFPVQGPFGWSEVKWLHLQDSNRLEADTERIKKATELQGTLLAKNFQSLSIVLNTESGISKKKSDEAVRAIKQIIDTYDFEEVKVAGRIFGQNYYVQKMEGELFLFTSISLVIVLLFLALAFRSVSGVAFPLIVVGISVVWLLGLMTVLGKSFDLMSSLLPTILFVVGTSDVVHIYSRYLEELRSGKVKQLALKTAFIHIGKATFLTSVTTAIGFITLLTSGIQPVRQFGLYTAVGVLIAFVVTFLVLPAILYLTPAPKLAQKPTTSLFWNKAMHGLFLFNIQHPKKILFSFLALTILAFWGASRVEVNNYLLEDLSENDPTLQNFLFFEENYSGARPFEVVVQSKDSTTLFTPERIRALAQMEETFQEEFEIQGFLSLVTVVKTLYRAEHGGAASFYRIPRRGENWTNVVRQLQKLRRQNKLKNLVSANGHETRISAQVKDFGGKVFKEKYGVTNKKVAGILAQNHLEMRYTGMAFLIDKNNETLASNLMFTLLYAFGAIALIMAYIFKSARMVVITLIPNFIPLLFIGGVMGAVGIDLKVSTSIIFTIAFGIAVDDTIHYVSKLKMELNKGRSLLYALKRTNLSTGKAIVITSLILIAGFFALVFSDFASTYYIGLLVSFTLVFAVLSDLFLLPVLIFLFYRKE